MALTKFNFNSFDLTTAASSGIAFNSSANGLETAASGALNLIATNTITSGVSSSSFTSGIDSTYDTYIFKYFNIHGATDIAELTVNFRDGSSAFDASKTSTLFRTYHREAAATATVTNDNSYALVNSTSYDTISIDPGNGSDEAISGTLYLFSPSSTTFVKHYIAITSAYGGYNGTEIDYVGGYCSVTAAIDRVDFKFSSGNIDSGVIKMYGVTK